MEASTTIRKMLAGNKITVPSYQRAYSWDTPVNDQERISHTDVFLNDLEAYSNSNTDSPYYFGHFLFEGKDPAYSIIDGQQRLTTIVIFLSVLFNSLKSIRGLTEDEEARYEDMVRRKSAVRFSTVDYDNQLFLDCVIEQTKKNTINLETVSGQRILDAFNYFKEQLSTKTDDYLTRMLGIISDSACTTHEVKDESVAIQMFIFHNNRGKKPSNLEIIKARFMYSVHLDANEDKDVLLKEIKNRFEKIYKSISLIEDKINEDDVLNYTLRVHFNSLWEGNALDRIDKELTKARPLVFIKEFTYSLTETFEYLSIFLRKDEQKHIEIHSLTTLGGITIAIPFIIKAYKYGVGIDEICKLCTSFESIVLRHRLIGTRADIQSRINDVFKTFSEDNKSIQPITDRINLLKISTDWWWAHWNNESLKGSLQGGLEHSVARYILWKYENWLESHGKDGYQPTRFDKIISPELEHIAPVKEPKEKPTGYCEYDEEFYRLYLDCLGNYLLLSKSHNCAVGNVTFAEKRRTYTKNEQQREIQRMVPENSMWSKSIINTRKSNIIDFVLQNF